MQKLILVICVSFLSISSCSEDENETCMNCSAVITTVAYDEVMTEAFLTMQEICGNQLEKVLANPTQTATFQSGSFTTTATTVYTCE
tara:strand:- start:256 stop:516 length:261 start_codon:yes stop_codon:yes gene_type:complete